MEDVLPDGVEGRAEVHKPDPEKRPWVVEVMQDAVCPNLTASSADLFICKQTAEGPAEGL